MPVRLLSGGQQQAVAISRALGKDAQIVILDEPTAALGVRQTRVVLEVIKAIAAAGVGVILISHDIEVIRAVSDTVVILRHGEVVHTGPNAELTQTDLVHLMEGLVFVESDPVRATEEVESR